MVLTTVLVFCKFFSLCVKSLYFLNCAQLQTTLHKMGQGSIIIVHMNSFVFCMYQLLMTVYSNSRLWLRRNMAKMQQMLVMRVVSLLISRWSINLCRCMAYCWMVTLLHNMIMVFKIQENKEGLELLKTAIEKAGYTGKVSSQLCLNQTFFQLLLNNAEIISRLGCYWNGCCSIWILWKGQNLWFELQKRGIFVLTVP